MEQLIAYRVLVQGKEKERGDCTVDKWERECKWQVRERHKGADYKVYFWPPQKWWKRGNNAS